MPYLTHNAWNLLDDQQIQSGMLNVANFEDRSDRTLTFGIGPSSIDPSRNVFQHIYLEGGQLRRHFYSVNGDFVTTQSQTAYEEIHVDQLMPTMAAPSATDLEFVNLMALFGKSLHFFEPGSAMDKELTKDRDDDDFFGLRQKYFFVNGHSDLC